jgi:hypothetical protein
LSINRPKKGINMNNTLEKALKLAKGPYSELALRYSFLMRDLVEKCKQPGFTPADWAPLARMVATQEFERIGNFREKVRWDQYDDLLTGWGKSTVWDFDVWRCTEGDHYAVIEMEEHATYPDRKDIYTSVSIHEYNADNKLRKLSIYLSKAEPLSSSNSHQWHLEEVAAQIT